MALFNAKDEQTKKVFFEELLDCIEEVCISGVFLCSLILSTDGFFFVGVSRYRVRTGHGKPGKSLNLRISFSRPGKSWNLIVRPRKSWK